MLTNSGSRVWVGEFPASFTTRLLPPSATYTALVTFDIATPTGCDKPVNGSTMAGPAGAADVDVDPEVDVPVVVVVALVVADALVVAVAFAVPAAFADFEALVVPLALVPGLLLLAPQAAVVTLTAMIATTQVRPFTREALRQILIAAHQ